MKLSATEGSLVPGENDNRVEITIDWEGVSTGFKEELFIDMRSEEGDFEQVHLPIDGWKVQETFEGLVEGEGCISIPASSYYVQHPYRVLPDMGLFSSGSVAVDLGAAQTAYLTYDVYTFTEALKIDLLLCFNMTLDVDPTNPMNYELLMDGKTTGTHQLLQKPTTGGESGASLDG